MIQGMVFVCGAVLMALEIVGSRILSPYFGDSLFVWGSLIGIFLGALSLGYYCGGIVSDRKPYLRSCAVIIAWAALSILIIPLTAGPLSRFIVSLNLGDRVSPLLACLALFFVPSVLLGMVWPFSVKLQTKGMDRVGNVTGLSYALSTLGSLFGTFFVAFYLIGQFGVISIVIFLGSVLVLLSASIWMTARERQKPSFVSLLTGALFLICVSKPPLFALPPGEIPLYQTDSFYHHITVTENRSSSVRLLRFGSHIQTGIFVSGPARSPFALPDMFHLPLVFNPGIRRALFIGGGGMLGPRAFYEDYPAVRIDAVEIDPQVARIAERFFFLPSSERIRVFSGEDGRRFIVSSDRVYDLIVADVFNSAGRIPFHLLTKNYFEELKAHLGPRGVVAFNLVGSFEGRGSRLIPAVYKTLKQIFPEVYIFPNYRNVPPGPRQRRNFFMIATVSSNRLSQEEILVAADWLERTGKVKVPLREYAVNLWVPGSEKRWLETIPILTDDYAPVDSLI